jgi:hypothetical protein
MSYSEIGKVTGISKSTLSYMLKDITLNKEQKGRLADKEDKNRSTMNERISDEQRKKGGHRCQELHGKDVQNITAEARELGHMAYRQDELPAKAALEKLHGCEFRKERIGKKIIDFASEEMLIEHSISNTTSRLAERFEVAIDAGDTRKMVAYIRFRKGKWRDRLLKMGVDVRHVDELDVET